MASVFRKCLGHQAAWSAAVGAQWTGIAQTRNFYRMLNVVFNRPDSERIKEVGPDRACAEWLLRCGAHPRWKGSTKFHTDYNTLPDSNLSKYKLEEINADDAAVMEVGFPHFNGCEHIQKIRFHHCPYLEDASIVQLVLLKQSLQHLEISSCGDVSDKGLASLTELHLLKSLYMYDLPAVRDKVGSYKKLQKALPDCTIVYKDLEPPKT